MAKLHKEHNYNLLASNMMSLHRTLPDSRLDECKELSYPEKLPRASIVIIFHNEAWTTLLRTVWSVLDRSPIELIEEIVLVDDLSTWSFLKRPLDDYVELLPVRIKIIRTSRREGLIRARLIGAQNAKGSVLVFLDAHMECNQEWLQPLLSRIASDRSVISVPLIDGISSDDMKYQFNTETFINGLAWTLGFTWTAIPERERIRTHHDKTATIRTATLVGCAFAVDRQFFFEIGGYDTGMNIWGSENVEMSLRMFAFTKNQMIATQHSEQCVGVSKKLDAVTVEKCVNHSSQLWEYDKEKKWMMHIASGYCMLANQTEVILGQCDSYDENFNWEVNATL